MRTSGHAISTQASSALAVGLIAFPVAAATGHPVAAATGHQAASRTAPAAPAPRGPGLSITVTDGRATAAAGQRLTYTVSVRDTGTAAARDLKITQTLSPGLRLLSANGNGTATATQVTWHASLPAGATRTFRVTARVTTPAPPRVTHLAAVACAVLPGDSRPIVCAAHLDRLPAAAPPTAGPGAPGGNLPLYAAAGLAALVAALLTATARRRTRQKRQPAPPLDSGRHAAVLQGTPPHDNG